MMMIFLFATMEQQRAQSKVVGFLVAPFVFFCDCTGAEYGVKEEAI